MKTPHILSWLLAAALPALAHHSTATFDLNHTMVLNGTVQTFQWTNPHVWLWLAVPGPGGTKLWGIESGAPVLLHRKGFTRDAFAPGEHVLVTIHPLKDGQLGGQFMIAKFDDGHQLRTPDPAAFQTPIIPGSK